jgi:Tol biopolymer transport system component
VAFYASNAGAGFFRRDLQSAQAFPAAVSYDGSPVSEGCIDNAAVLSKDGRYLAFGSCANNLVPNDTTQSSDVFVRDFVAGTTVRVSDTLDRPSGSRYSFSPSLNADGSRVAFVWGNTFLDADVIVRERPSP